MLHKLKHWLIKNRTEIIIAVFLFLLAFLPRIINLTGHSIFTDEVLWQQRAGNFIKAFGSSKYYLLTKADKMLNTLTIGLPTTVLIALSKLLLSRWASPAFYSRLPFTFIGSFTAVGFYLFMRRIKKPEIGIIGAFFLALEPSFIAMSRWAHRDVMLTFLFFLSIAFFYLGETEDKFSFKIYSAIFFSMAFLAKVSAIIIPIIIVSWKLLLYLRASDNTKKKITEIVKFNFKLKELSLPFLSASLIFLLWPAMWSNPVKFALSYSKSQFTELEGGRSRMLFLGKIYNAIPSYYYLVILFIRLSPIILFSLAIGVFLFFLAKNTKVESDIWTLSILWLFLFIAIASLSSKVYEIRYMLPIWPAIAYLAGYGLFQLFSYVRKLNKNQVTACACALIALFELPVIFIYSPNYYMYYNVFAGGPSNVHKNKMSFVGGAGEASKPLAAYVIKHFKENKKITYFGFNNQFDYYLDKNLKKRVKYNPYYYKKWKTNNKLKIAKIYHLEDDVVVLEDTVGILDVGPTKKYILKSGKFKIAYTTRIHGLDLGWVFVRKSATSN